jgi:hypothetical protein
VETPIKKRTFYRDSLEEEVDCPPSVSTTQEGHVVETYLVEGKSRFFVTLAGLPYCAHGDSIAEAIADALWKDEKRRPSMEAVKESILINGRSHKITLQEFRLLTGACSVGCKVALKNAGLSGSPMLIEDILRYFPDWGSKLQNILGWEK